MTTTTLARRNRLLPALAITPVLRWLIIHHSVEDEGLPWQTRCLCGEALWPRASGPSGRCEACSVPAGPRPYLLEATAVLALAVLAVSGLRGWELAAYTWWTAGALVLGFIDLAAMRLPFRITATMGTGFVALLALAGNTSSWWRAILAAALVTTFFAVLSVASRGQFGWGDVAVAVPVGAALGWNSWLAVLIGVLLAFTVALGTAIGLRLAAGETLPFGPFLLASALTSAVLL